MKKLLIIGSVHTELLTYVKELPKGNEEPTVLSSSQSCGGGGYTAGRCFSRLNFPFEVICDPGEGVYGDYARKQAKKEGISLSEGSGETGGATWRMIDPQGNDAAFLVDGSEYHFSLEQVYDIDPAEFGAIAVYSEMLAGMEPDELVDALRELELPLYAVYGERAAEIMDETREALNELSPVLIMDDRDAFALNGKKEKPEEIAGRLCALTKEAVIILSESGVLYRDEKDTWVAPCKKRPSRDLWAAYFIASQMAGVDRKNGMMFANEAAIHDDPETASKRLAGMILHR